MYRIESVNRTNGGEWVKATQEMERRRAIRHAAQLRGAPEKLTITAPRGELTSFRRAVRDYRRGTRRLFDPLERTIEERRTIHRLQVGMHEIYRRGVSTPHTFGEGVLTPRITDSTREHWVIHASGWVDYTSRERHFCGASYLCGWDDEQLFAVRVPLRVTTVSAAIAWLMPSAVASAVNAGKDVRRQGDFFFIQRARKSDLSALVGSDHEARGRKDGGWTIVHPQHRPLRLSGKCRWEAIPARSINGDVD